MSMARRVLLLFVCLSLTALGCGDTSDPAGDPDAGADGTPPRIISSSPQDGARPVSVLAHIRLVASEPLDEQTIDANSVSLTGAYDVELVVAVSYDATTSTIVVVPDKALAYGAGYSLTLAETVTDVAGNTIVPLTVTFKTYVNAIAQTTYYTNSAVSAYFDQTYDDGGKISSALWTTGAGVDGTWRTADDVVAEAYRYTWTSLQFEALTFDDPGKDGEWLTADDRVSWRSVSALDAFGSSLISTIRNPGDDGIWLTADDGIDRYDVYERTDGVTLRTVRYTDPGTDGLWHTSDDIVAWYRGVELADGRPFRDAWYSGPGDDGVWFTVDDVVGAFTELNYDSKGKRLRFVNYSDPGQDGLWFTADDVVQRWVGYSHDANGLLTSQTWYDGAGADGEWFTDDDSIEYLSTMSHDAATGNRLDTTSYDSPGQDGVWRTSDDRVERAHSHLTDR